jgi:precorrin-2 dehydrogenase / sirohydrochlorin ferrochelatase
MNAREGLLSTRIVWAIQCAAGAFGSIDCRLASFGNTQLYAANLNLRGVPVLVVGGGEVALRKVTVLLEAGAQVTVVSPEFHPELSGLKRSRPKGSGQLTLARRKFAAGDVKKNRLVFAATHDEALNTRIAEASGKQGVFVNVAAPGDAGSFQVPATVRRGKLSIAISTGGASAALARTVRERVEKVVGPEWGELAGLLEARRSPVLEKIQDPQLRNSLLKKLGMPRWAAMIKKHGSRKVAAEMDSLILRAAGNGKRGAAK